MVKVKWFMWLMSMVVLCGIATVQAQDPDPGVLGLLDGASFDVLTTARTNMIQGRVEFPMGDVWGGGPLFEYFTRDIGSGDTRWGVGGFAKLKVDPNATIPLANWIPKLGDWMNLPETLTGETYLIGTGEVLPYEGSIDLALSVGPGMRVGPILIEYAYKFVESGDADSPALSSKGEFRIGCKPITSLWPLKFVN